MYAARTLHALDNDEDGVTARKAEAERLKKHRAAKNGVDRIIDIFTKLSKAQRDVVGS
jgi:hypothetical protein